MSAAEAAVADFVRPIREAVRSRPEPQKCAIVWAARFFGLSERRIRACLHGEVRSVLAWEMVQVQQRFRAHLEEQERRMEHELVILRARRVEADATVRRLEMGGA